MTSPLTLPHNATGHIDKQRVGPGRFFRDSSGRPILYLLVDQVEVGPILASDALLQTLRNVGITIAEMLTIQWTLPQQDSTTFDALPNKALARLASKLKH